MLSVCLSVRPSVRPSVRGVCTKISLKYVAQKAMALKCTKSAQKPVALKCTKNAQKPVALNCTKSAPLGRRLDNCTTMYEKRLARTHTGVPFVVDYEGRLVPSFSLPPSCSAAPSRSVSGQAASPSLAVMRLMVASSCRSRAPRCPLASASSPYLRTRRERCPRAEVDSCH